MPNRSRKSQRPEPSSLVVRAGFLKKNFHFSQTDYFTTGITYFSVFVLINRIYNQTIFRTNLK